MDLKVVKFPSVFKIWTKDLTDLTLEEKNKSVFYKNAYYLPLSSKKKTLVETIPYNVDDLIEFYPLVIMQVEKEIGAFDSVAVSLPIIDFYNSVGKELPKIIKEKTGKDSISLPQGLLGILDIAEKNQDILNHQTILLLDGGFNTVNITISTFNKDENSFDVIFTETYYNQFGIRNLLNLFLEEIRQRQGLRSMPADYGILKDAFLNGEYTYAFNKYDLSAEKQRASQIFFNLVLNKIRKDIDIKAPNTNYSAIAIVGGISHYLQIDANIPVYYGDEFSTVKGMAIHSDMVAVDFGFGDIKICWKGE